jgi:hypothetical protein
VYFRNEANVDTYDWLKLGEVKKRKLLQVTLNPLWFKCKNKVWHYLMNNLKEKVDFALHKLILFMQQKSNVLWRHGKL